jgi:RNA-directed DNA polymerase
MELQARETLSGPRTGITVRTKLASIAQVASRNKKAKFNSLAYLMNKNTLKESFRRLNKSASPGIDNIDKEDYGQKLEENIDNLIKRLKKGSFRPLPVRRKYIPKAGSNKMRPLGIMAIEDKIVQGALVIILQSIYEEDFLSVSFGFRPGKSQHDALKKLGTDITRGKVNYIVDADIRSFFDTINHEWLMKFLEHRINDSKILSLIKRFLKAGIFENGKTADITGGVAQGGSLSPLLGNIYLHYVLDLWFQEIVSKKSNGEAYITRFADDSVACFENEEDAIRYFQSMQQRLTKFGLEIAREKSKIIQFGRFAEVRVKRELGHKPETFEFLGFTHYCGKSRKGYFSLKRKTSSKKLRTKINEFRQWMKENRYKPLTEIWKSVNLKLRGHYNYYGVSDNWNQLAEYKVLIVKIIYYWLRRRSQRTRLDWDKFNKLLKIYPLVNPKPKSLVYLNATLT